MSEQKAYDAANKAYQDGWQRAVPVRGAYGKALRDLERNAPDDVEGCVPFVERFLSARAALAEAEAGTKALLAAREAAYKALAAAGG